MNPLAIIELEIIVGKIVGMNYCLKIVYDYHGCGCSNGEWVNMDEFFSQVRLAATLCAKYKHVLLPLLKMKIRIEMDLHISCTAT